MSEAKTRRPGRPMVMALALAGAICGCSGDPGNGSSGAVAGKVGHVFIVILENENADTTFGPGSPAPYLAQTLPSLGAFVPNYYGTGHLSLDNYISMVSGQSPNSQTQSDCNYYADFVLANPAQTAPDEEGQVTGQGCVYPAFVKTIADQLEAVGLDWREYAQDMGADASRGNGSPTCSHPPLTNPPTQDKTQSANAIDQYAARHNPFMYFHSIIDNQANCDARVVELGVLDADLASVATTPNYVFITPDLCNDGHDAPCKDGAPGGLEQVNTFLQALIPKILNSPAFKQDGLLIVTFDEAEFSQNDPSGSDVTACCNEPSGPNTTTPGVAGAGGGRVGAVLISPLIKPGTVVSTDYAYNHYSMLRSIEDIFGLPYLGYAGQANLKAFGPEIFNNTNP